MQVVNLLFDTPIYLTLLAVGLSLLAAVFWWFFFKQRSRELTTRNASILMLFIVGVVMVIPLALVESSVVDLLPQNFKTALFSPSGELTGANVGAIAFVMFFIAAGFEELSKSFFIKRIMPNREIDQVIDSIKFGISIGIGFAVIENALFLLAPLNAGNYADVATTFFLRFFFSTLAHAVYSGIAGYYFGKAKFEPWRRRRNLLVAYLAPILVHGLFNTLLLLDLAYYALPLILIFFFFLLRWYQSKKANKKYAIHKPSHTFGV